MISTFDLTLLGMLVSIGGLLFLQQGRWPELGGRWLTSTGESRERLERSAALAGIRWLTLGALTLLLAYAKGAEEGYLFSPLGDVLFHIVFVPLCWGMTAFKIKQSAERRTNEDPISALSLPDSRSSQPGN